MYTFLRLLRKIDVIFTVAVCNAASSVCGWEKEVTLIREVVCESFHSLTHRNTRWENCKKYHKRN